MSSFIVCCGDDAHNRSKTLCELMPTNILLGQGQQSTVGLDENWHHYYNEQLAISVNGSDGGITESNGVILAFEGYVTHQALRGEALRLYLIEDFLQHQEHCPQHWRGSFRVIIHYQGVTRIYTDQLANRRLFYVQNPQGASYCSHATPLLSGLKPRTIDGANLLQFLLNGRFFSDGTLFKQLKQLPAGMGHRIEQSNRVTQVTPFTWYQYTLQSAAQDSKDALPEFKHLLDQAILSHWQRADNPALILSGGYDSRYLLNSLAQLLPQDEFDTLSTYLWGNERYQANSDAVWAEREAKRHKVPYELHPSFMPDTDSFELMFQLQSGMTGHVFSHNSDMKSCQILAQQGKHSKIRGDEIFGPNGQQLNTREQALAKVGLTPLPTGSWALSAAFNLDISDWREEHASKIDNLAQLADEPNDLRDLLYCRERYPAFNSHLTTHRAPFIESFNPLLDINLVDFSRRLPRELRTDKSLFRQCFMHYYPTNGFATFGEGFNWQNCWRHQPLSTFIQQQLAQLPAPFNPAFWTKIGQQLNENIQGNSEQVAAIQLATRAMVLGRWLQ